MLIWEKQKDQPHGGSGRERAHVFCAFSGIVTPSSSKGGQMNGFTFDRITKSFHDGRAKKWNGRGGLGRGSAIQESTTLKSEYFSMQSLLCLDSSNAQKIFS